MTVQDAAPADAPWRTPRWPRGSVATRLLCAVVLPLVLLGAVTSQQALRLRGEAHDARQLADRIGVLDDLVALHSALFLERVQAEVLARSEHAASSDEGSASFLATQEGDVAAIRTRTDAALAAVAVEDRPFGVAALKRLRLGLDGRAWTPPVVAERYDEQQLALVATIQSILVDAGMRAVRVGDTQVAAAIEVVRTTIEVLSASGSLVTDLAQYWYAVPFEASLARSELAGSDQAYTTAVTWLHRRATGVVGDTWPAVATSAPRFGEYVLDALEGAASPLVAEPTMAGPLSALAEGVDRTRGIGELSPLASAVVRDLAGDLAATARQRADEATLLAAASTIASLLAALWFGRSIVSPVRRFTQHARCVGAGDLDVEPLPLDGPPELAEAASAFNELVANLQLMELKAHALAAGDLEAPVLAEPLAGRLGESLHRSVHLLSGSIEERERLQARLAHQATHDSLTGIPNRAAVIDYLERATARARRAGRLLGVLFIDLDDFKRVNDTHGHQVGDAVLRETAQRMSATARSGDLLARLGGDEFLLVAEDLAGIEEAAAIAQRMVQAISVPVHVGALELRVGACAGIALAQDDDDPLTLLRHADLAVYSAKRRGQSSVVIYDDTLQHQLLVRADIEDALRTALASHDQLRLEYQPLVDTATGRLSSVEALLRWDRPGHGCIRPDDFIPVAEASKLIVDIDRWVLREATAQLLEWAHHPQMCSLDVAVNISGRHMLDPDFVAHVAGAIAESGIDAGRLVLEVTETVLVTDLAHAAAQLQAVRDLGVRVAVDDFGTGYTSLAHLRSLPIDTIKLDRSFVQGLPEAMEDQSLIRIVRDLARHLGVSTVAEGVETDGQRMALEDLGYDVLQGYHFSHPLRPAALVAWAEDQLHAAVAGAPGRRDDTST